MMSVILGVGSWNSQLHLVGNVALSVGDLGWDWAVGAHRQDFLQLRGK